MKLKPVTIQYYSLFPLLKSLEKTRKGIRDRVWDFLCDEKDAAWRPYNGRIMGMNLFFYGIGNEYPTKYLEQYPGELEHSKKIHPEAFKEGTKEYELRLDFNLIWSICGVDGEYIETFYVLTSW